MKIIVNYPELEEDKLELENRIADFHATLLLERINQLNIRDKFKRDLLNKVLDHLKN